MDVRRPAPSLPGMEPRPKRDQRDELIAHLERENARLADLLARVRPALHGLAEDLARSKREAADWRVRYRQLAAQHGGPDPRREMRSPRPRRLTSAS
jgi:hypothetical protein